MTLAAVAQLTSSAVIAENLAVATSLIKRAAAAGAKALFLPEATDFISPATSVATLSRSAEGRSFIPSLCDAARESGIWVSVGVHESPDAPVHVAGATPSPPQGKKMQDEQRCWNSQVLIDAEGVVRANYRKLYLFDVNIAGGLKIMESGTTIPGTEIGSPVSTPLGMLGLQTCYDLRFPESSLALRSRGAQILTYPSAFTERTGAAHWEVLLRARALDTQCWVLAAAQVGAHPGSSRVSYGHAMVVDPWGSVVASVSDMRPYKPSFCLADVDLEALESMRKEMPLWSQRRWDAYPQL